MIYYRALASLMKEAKVNASVLSLLNNNCIFKATGSVFVFDGYLKVYSKYETSDDKIIPEYKTGDILTSNEIVKEQHFTKPPARYTEAKLIKELEELGIGRPSTYATIIDTIVTRQYVNLID